MKIDEQIKFYVDNGMSFMLHGYSGVGKSRRIKDIDPDFTSIVLRNGMLPEELMGKTIYRVNDNSLGGEWKAPAWYVNFCEKCEAEPDKNHILFIDEMTNAKETVQSMVYDLVLNKSIGPNLGKLPENSVVAVAGNYTKDSAAAYNIPEPLFRRFVGHVELPLDIPSFLEWGSEPQDEKDKSRLRIHPVVASFVSTFGDKVFYSDYDPENPPKYALDPRCWEQVSDIIYDNKGVIAKELIENKIGEENAKSFLEFARTPLLSKEDILEDSYEENEDIPTRQDAKYALALSLRSATEEELPKIRDFIKTNLGKEILSMYDSVWVNDNSERAIYLDSIKGDEDTIEEVVDETSIEVELKKFKEELEEASRNPESAKF